MPTAANQGLHTLWSLLRLGQILETTQGRTLTKVNVATIQLTEKKRKGRTRALTNRVIGYNHSRL